MTELLPKWIMRRYIKLRKELGSEKFSFKEAQEALEDDGRVVNLFLSELRKAGWLTSEQHPDDSRKKLYQLKAIENVMKELEREVK